MTTELRSFLITANKAGYGNNEAVITTEEDGGHTIRFKDGRFSFCDYFYGGHPYSGQEVIYERGKPVWAMQYRGWVHNTDLTPSDVYNIVLKPALLNAPVESPYRGPTELTVENGYSYRNKWTGDMTNFRGEENIELNGQEIYKGLYFGGLVNGS